MVDVTCSWANMYDKWNVIYMIMWCIDDGNLECGVDNPIIWMTWVFLVADLGIK